MLAKLTPLQTLVVFLGCLVAIIVAHRLAPGAVALVASLSGTVVAALLRPPGAAEPPAPPASPGGGAPPDPPPTVPEGRGALRLGAAGALALALLACTPGQRQAARSVVDAATVACLVANATLPDAEVRRVCGIVDALDGPLADILRTSRAQVAEARAGGELAGASRCASPRQ